VAQNAGERKFPVAVFFFLCAAVDFALAYIRWRSVGAGLVAIVFGVPFNVLLFFLSRAAWNVMTTPALLAASRLAPSRIRQTPYKIILSF
jgi:hypothetical protein